MKITERESMMLLEQASRWKLHSIRKDEAGMPTECVLYQESNMYLPHKVKMVFEEVCDD